MSISGTGMWELKISGTLPPGVQPGPQAQAALMQAVTVSVAMLAHVSNVALEFKDASPVSLIGRA